MGTIEGLDRDEFFGFGPVDPNASSEDEKPGKEESRMRYKPPSDDELASTASYLLGVSGLIGKKPATMQDMPGHLMPEIEADRDRFTRMITGPDINPRF